jgi:hypothetical protein
MEQGLSVASHLVFVAYVVTEAELAARGLLRIDVSNLLGCTPNGFDECNRDFCAN